MKLIRGIIKWVGLGTMIFGGITILWALWVIVRYKTGWGLSEIDHTSDDWARIALSLLLSGMFFFLVGAGAVLISRYGINRSEEPSTKVPRWVKPVMVLLFVSGFGSIALATVFAGMTDEFGDATAGIVSYCMLIGVGLLFSGWGLKRAGDREEESKI